MNVLMTTDTLKDLTTLPIMFEARLLAFWSVPPSISREEVCLKDETTFEC